MDYENFKTNLIEGIKEFYEETVNVEYDNVLKNNGQYCDALRITDKESGKVIPVIYIEKLYEKYLNGELSMKECVLKVCKLREESECPEELKTFVKQLMKWDFVKDKIYPILISLEHNQELLKELVYTQMLDLAVIYAVRVKLEDGECGIVKVSKDLLKAYEIDENQLHDTAMDNLKKDGYRFQKINDLIGRCLHPMKLKENEVDRDKLEKLVVYYRIVKWYNINKRIEKRSGITMTDISTIKKTIAPIARSYGVKRIYLFGSYAKGNATENSDIDLLVEKGKPMSLLKLSGMRQSVQEALDLSVDLVTTAGIEDAFYKEIAGTEILLYEE